MADDRPLLTRQSFLRRRSSVRTDPSPIVSESGSGHKWRTSCRESKNGTSLGRQPDPYHFLGIPLWCLSLVVCLLTVFLLILLVVPIAIVIYTNYVHSHCEAKHLTIAHEVNNSVASIVLNYASTNLCTFTDGNRKSTNTEIYTLMPNATGQTVIPSSLVTDGLLNQYYALVPTLAIETGLPHDWGHANYVEGADGRYRFVPPKTSKNTTHAISLADESLAFQPAIGLVEPTETSPPSAFPENSPPSSAMSKELESTHHKTTEAGIRLSLDSLTEQYAKPPGLMAAKITPTKNMAHPQNITTIQTVHRTMEKSLTELKTVWLIQSSSSSQPTESRQNLSRSDRLTPSHRSGTFIHAAPNVTSSGPCMTVRGSRSTKVSRTAAPNGTHWGISQAIPFSSSLSPRTKHDISSPTIFLEGLAVANVLFSKTSSSMTGNADSVSETSASMGRSTSRESPTVSSPPFPDENITQETGGSRERRKITRNAEANDIRR